MHRPTSIYICCDPVTMEARYVGKTVHDVKTRIQNHLTYKGKRHSSAWFQKVKEPYYFTAEVVPAGGDWVAAEQFWIAYLKSLGARLVNATAGGEGMQGYKASDETRAKISAANKGKTFSPESVAKRAASLKGKKRSEESKARMSAAQIAREPFPPEVRANMSKAQQGRKMSLEAIAKAVASRKGYKHSEETREKLKTARRLRVTSEETKAKLSASMKQSWADRKATNK